MGQQDYFHRQQQLKMGYRLMEIPRVYHQRVHTARDILQPTGQQMQYAGREFHDPTHLEDPGAQISLSLGPCRITPYHQINIAGFIFEGDEDNTTGSPRPLPADHQPGHSHILAMTTLPQRGGAVPLAESPPLSAQCQRMAPQS